MIYRFRRVELDGTTDDVQSRDLPDDQAARDWMGGEFLLRGQRLFAFRDGEERPFAERGFAQEVE